MNSMIESLEHRQFLHAAFTAAINFAPVDAPRAPGMLTDYGSIFDYRRGGYRYGWSVDTGAGAVDRNLPISVTQRNDTFIQFQTAGTPGATWELEVPENGLYKVYVVAGDPALVGERMAINVENEVVIAGMTKSRKRWLEGSATVNVTDGRITVTSSHSGVTNKINYIFVEAVDDHGSGPLPQLQVTTVISNAYESGASHGAFRLTRGGDLSKSLTVPLIVEGTATNGVDYGRIGDKFTFAPGQSSVDLYVRAANDGVTEGNETVILKIGPVSGYTVVNLTDQDPVTIVDHQTPSSQKTLSWTSKANAPIAKSEVFGTAVGGKLYVFGGYQDMSFKPANSARVYNPATNTWSEIASLPVGYTHVAHAEDDRYIYFAGGYPGTGPNGNQVFATNKVFYYDTQTDTYGDLPNLPAARGGGAMALLDRKLYFAGGNDISRVDKTDAWVLDLDNTAAGWTAIANLPGARNHPAMVSLNGFVYFVGGQQLQDDAAIYSSNVWRYSPGANAWTSVASLPVPRSHITSATFVYDGRIITIGGETTGRTVINTVSQYDPTTNTWSTLQNLPAARFSGVGALISPDTFIYTSGYNGGFKNNTYLGVLTA